MLYTFLSSPKRELPTQTASQPVDPPPKRTHSQAGAWVAAEGFVRNSLKSPSSADFGGFLTDVQHPSQQAHYQGDGEYVVTGWVDGTNTFGAKLRADFRVRVKYRPGDESWSLLEGPTITNR
jgi:hypothetical protein